MSSILVNELVRGAVSVGRMPDLCEECGLPVPLCNGLYCLRKALFCLSHVGMVEAGEWFKMAEEEASDER